MIGLLRTVIQATQKLNPLNNVIPSGFSELRRPYQCDVRRPAVREESFAARHQSHGAVTGRPLSKGFLVGNCTLLGMTCLSLFELATFMRLTSLFLVGKKLQLEVQSC